ncbi:hypothetical protein BDV93DRAFT_522773 [Ceratobasidium sp. AG-I]|nr:hypothetical protein BDV93DRAFT_522773 [Ceratobasidium sp. AG-I]
MSINSTRSTLNGRLTDDALYQYCLRVAYLTYLITPRPRKAEEPEEVEPPPLARTETSRLSALINFADLIPSRGDGGREVKFPRDFLKVIEEKMQIIAMGRDPLYIDQFTRRTVAAFWGSFKDQRFMKQMKDNRRIEELILMYVTSSTSILKRDKALEGDGWKIELNKQVATFIRILRDTLRTVHHVPAELTSRLEMYSTKLTPPKEEAQLGPSTSVRRAPKERDSWVQVPSEGSIADMPLVQTVGKLFGIDDATLQKDVNAAAKICTDKAAIVDLKTCLKNIAVGMPFPGRREDFQSDAVFQQWRTTENSQLSQLMVAMIRHNPALAKFTPSDISATAISNATGRPESMYSEATISGRHDSISSRFSTISVGDSEDESSDSFTYIPPNPKKAYKRLVEICVDADLNAMNTLPEDQEVSLTILSARNHEIINECAVRWRVMQTYRVASFLDVVRYKYEREEVPLECVPEALQVVNKTIGETPLDHWPSPDIDYLSTIYGSLYNIVLGVIYHSVKELSKLKPDAIMPYDDILRLIHGHKLLARYEDEINNRLRELSDHIRTTAVHEYTELSNDLLGVEDPDRAFPLLELSTRVEKTAKLLDKRFAEPLTGGVDIVSLVVESQVPLYLGDLEDQREVLFAATVTADPPTTSVDSVFDLYRRVGSLLKLHAAFCPESGVAFDLVGYFEPYVHYWIRQTDSKTIQWVEAAIAEDKFIPEGDDRNSSSIVDLFGSLNSPIDFILDLNWPDEYHNARFLTRLASTISQAIEKYCRSVEDLFESEMFPRGVTDLQPQKQSAWLEKAKQFTNVGEKKVEVFNFTPEPCVKLNNVEAARKLLDNIQRKMEVDKIVMALEDQPPPPPDKSEKSRYLFTVKIVQAENLVSLDNDPSAMLDTFLVMSDEHGTKLAKTKTIYDTLNPRWEETFDITVVEKPLWVMASIRDRQLIGNHDTVGRGYLCLDPRRFGDFLTHDLWIDLEPAGRLLVRVSMEGEKDDVMFYFGRAFRSLKRTESEMARIFVNKMSPIIRHSLSRTVLRSLIKSKPAYDYNKAIGNVTALYRSALGAMNEPAVPLPPEERQQLRKQNEALGDLEIEAAIAPLFDHFDVNLPVLHSNLSETTREMVMIKVWKEILSTLENLLLPPLSDVPTDMKPLAQKEVEIVFKWLEFLRNYLNAGGGGLPNELLQNQRYRDLMTVPLYYDWTTDDLMEECVRVMQQNLRSSSSTMKRAKSVYSQNSLGTIKQRKREKKKQSKNQNSDVILRILRMRPGTGDFIRQQIAISATMLSEAERPAQPRLRPPASNGEGRRSWRASRASPVPPVPPLPR